MKWVNQGVEDVYQGESPEVLQKAGIEVIKGAPTFLNCHTVEVNGQEIVCRNFILTTGAHPYIPHPGIRKK